MMRDTILYISGPTTCGSSASGAIEAAGCDLVSTNCSTQAVALLFVMHSSAAVVLDQRTCQETSPDLIRNLRSICPDVPILMICRNQIGGVPSDVEIYLTTGQPLENLTSAVRRLLTAAPMAVEAGHCASAGSTPPLSLEISTPN